MSFLWRSIGQRLWIVLESLTVYKLRENCFQCKNRNAMLEQHDRSNMFAVNQPPFYCTGAYYFRLSC